MKSSLYLIPFIAAVLSAPAVAADYLSQEEANRAYMSPEIDTAVEAAKRFPSQAEYVGYEWYNRTTSKSFPLPKMLNTEMNNLIIEGAMGPTAAGEAAAQEASRPVRQVALGNQTEDEEVVETDENLQPSAPEKVKEKRSFFVSESRSINKTGETISRNIRGQNITISTRQSD